MRLHSRQILAFDNLAVCRGIDTEHEVELGLLRFEVELGHAVAVDNDDLGGTGFA